MMPYQLAIDFDGTLVKDNYPEIGEPHMELISILKIAKKCGFILILYTCREGIYLQAAVEFLKELGLEFDCVNDNYNKNFDGLGNCRKIGAHFYYDDRSFNWNYLDAVEHIRNLIQPYLRLRG